MAPHTVIGPPGPLHLPRWSELWEAREVLWRFGQRDILLRYRQTLIGVAWVILQPIVTAGVFALVFGRVAQLPTGGIPYFLFGYVGTLLWTVFASTVNRAAGSLVSNQALVSKVFFPRLLVPLSTCVSVLVDFLVALVIGFGLLWWFGVWPGWAILTIPVWVTLCVALAMGIGLAAAAIMVRYRDIAYVLPWAVQTLLYASSRIPSKPFPTRSGPTSWPIPSPGCSKGCGGPCSARPLLRSGRSLAPSSSAVSSCLPDCSCSSATSASSRI